MRLLLVEDDPLLGDGLAAGLTQVGYCVEWIREGQQALKAIRSDKFELIVLDLGLPGVDGMDILKKIRSQKDNTPILILTARDVLQDRIDGLDNGADDYLTKPFDLSELAARLRAIHRRRTGDATPQQHYGNITLNPASRSVTQEGQPVELTHHEFSILEILMNHNGRIATKEHLEESLYGWESGAESNTIEVHIHHLRKKLGKRTIHTVRGVGYQLPSPPE
ncbi:MAG: response regulator transcription factor [Gammaproteobacteria bacterium]|nr:response regulator transcription factor [Gammaproteobacteria bacterium]